MTQNLDEPMSPERVATVADFRERAQERMSPREVADHVFHPIRTEQLYILTRPELNSEVQERMDHILQQRKPD